MTMSLKRRLASYPTLGMTTEQLIAAFPDGGQVNAVADGKVSYPGDTLLTAMYEVQTYKRNQDRDKKKADGSVVVKAEPTDAEKAAQKKADQETASRIFGELYALPKNQRMAALVKMPVEDIITFTTNGNLTGDQKNMLLADFSPREAETFRAMAAHINTAYNDGDELAQGRMLRDVLSERQLLAVMTNFWFNHFNVYQPKDSDQWYTTGYERDVIAKNALGKFSDLLLATAQSPAMMVYLDNWLSIGPDSLANGVNPANPKSKKGGKGLNENYGREVMELHTVGVNGGYTQADVTALSAILTGWGVDKPNEGGGFLFDPKRHEPGPKVWMGYLIQENGSYTKLPAGVKRTGPTFGPGVTPEPLDVATDDSVKQGIAALKILAASPQTAHFIGTLLAQYFVADVPPALLVERLTEELSGERWGHQDGVADADCEPGVQLAAVLSEQGKDAGGVCGFGVPGDGDGPAESERDGGHREDDGDGALSCAAADGVLPDGGPVDELGGAGGPAELCVSADERQVCEPEVRCAEAAGGGVAGAFDGDGGGECGWGGVGDEGVGVDRDWGSRVGEDEFVD